MTFDPADVGATWPPSRVRVPAGTVVDSVVDDVSFSISSRPVSDAMPIVRVERGDRPLFLRPGDEGYEEMVWRGGQRRILEAALERLCCGSRCGHCGARSSWDEDCPLHGDGDLEP